MIRDASSWAIIALKYAFLFEKATVYVSLDKKILTEILNNIIPVSKLTNTEKLMIINKVLKELEDN